MSAQSSKRRIRDTLRADTLPAVRGRKNAHRLLFRVAPDAEGAPGYCHRVKLSEDRVSRSHHRDVSLAVPLTRVVCLLRKPHGDYAVFELILLVACGLLVRYEALTALTAKK
jgi:hypothetical protein